MGTNCYERESNRMHGERLIMHEKGYEHITKDKNAWARLRMHKKD